jgi:hypothetical protein
MLTDPFIVICPVNGIIVAGNQTVSFRVTWELRPTALFRAMADPVFLRPRFWPKACWQCCGRGTLGDNFRFHM